MGYDSQLDGSLRRGLAPGERVLWAGQPAAGAVLVDYLWAVLFTIIWVGMGIAFIAQSASTGETSSIVFGTVILATGLYGGGATFLEWRAAGSTFYAITDKRLIITRVGSGTPLKSLRITTLRGAERMSPGSRSTIRIPMGLVSDGDVGERLEYLKLYGVTEPDRVVRLLTA